MTSRGKSTSAQPNLTLPTPTLFYTPISLFNTMVSGGRLGKFIALEGLDGSGQSTQRVLLKKWFEERGEPCLSTKEPTDNLIGGLIRAQLTNEWKSSNLCLQLLFAADRAHHLEKEIVPSLERGIHVITDRYLFSSIAYGSVEVSEEWLKKVNSKFPLPDKTFYLDVSPKICLERLTGDRLRLELFEKEEYLEKVRENYLKLAKEYHNFHVINGEKSPEVIHKEITKIVEKLL